jgi:hypothetical protein
MSKKIVLVVTSFLAVLALALGVMAWANGNADQVDYPEGYRQWAHVKSMVLQAGHPFFDTYGGIHHVYANAQALAAMKAGKPHADGAALVVDLLEATSENNAISEGSRKLIDVMQKDAQKFAATGGWGFERFKGDTQERVVTDAKSACFACHARLKERDYVFSTYRQ